MKIVVSDATDEQFKRLQMFVESCMEGVTLTKSNRATSATKLELVLWEQNKLYVYAVIESEIGRKALRPVGQISKSWDLLPKGCRTKITTLGFSLYDRNTLEHHFDDGTTRPAYLSEQVLNLIEANRGDFRL